MPTSKSARQSLLRDILAKGPIPSQDALRRALHARGQRVDQATVSRDLKQLGALKTALGYVLPERLDQARTGPRGPVRLEHVFAVATAENLVILKTPPGQASPTAIELDRSGLAEILGTVAGDDTIFVATPNARAARRLAKAISGGEL
ncbi:MAG: ArgR family transcriptional regulator [Planctomycetota bacterium]